MAETIRIDGLAQLEKNLRDLAPAIQGKKGFPKNVLRNAARAMAKVVKDDAVARAPMSSEGSETKDGEIIPPGRLKRSITMKLLSARYRDRATLAGDSRELYYIGYKTGRGRDDPKGAYYGTMVELGTDKMSAQPFLRPAAIANKTKAPAVFKQKLGGDLERIAKKLGTRNKPRR